MQGEYAALYHSLKAYFEGDSSPLSFLDPIDQEAYALWRDYYLTLYGLLHDGWKEIANAASVDGWDSLLGKSPGETLLKILFFDCAGCFDRAFQYCEWSQGEMYRLGLEANKLRKVIQAEAPLSKGQDQQSRNINSKLKRMRQNSDPFMALTLYCVSACRKAAKRNRVLKRKLEAFDRHKEDWGRFMTSKKVLPASHGWKSGGKTVPVKGGSYLNVS